MFVLCLLTGQPLVGQSTCVKHAKTESALIEVERAWAHAYDERDVAAMSCLLASKYRHTGYDGKVIDRGETLARLARLSKQGASRHELRDIKPVLFGDTAVVYGESRAFEPDGTVFGVMRFTDVFVYRNRRWLAVSEHESRVN